MYGDDDDDDDDDDDEAGRPVVPSSAERRARARAYVLVVNKIVGMYFSPHDALHQNV
jgi:hypothetical protein